MPGARARSRGHLYALDEGELPARSQAAQEGCLENACTISRFKLAR